jgi:protein tyrosine/serine phosphatase
MADITDGYVKMLTNYKDNVKGSFEFLAQCMRENKPVYFHCAIGRDRTGTFAMLVLGLLGVSEGDIAKDYELTYFAPDGISTNDGGEFQYTRTKSSAYAAISKHIWAFGKPTFQECTEAYLLSIGVSQKDMDDIRNAMLVE